MTAKMHRVHFPGVGEGVVYKPGGVPWTYDDEKKWPYGSFLRLGDKGFVYANALSLLDTAFGARGSEGQKMGYMNVAADVAVGSFTITVTVTATQNIGLNQLAGGYVHVFANTINAFTRGIVSNTAIVTSGTMTIVMDSPAPVPVTAGDGVEATTNPYASVVSGGSGNFDDVSPGGHYNMILGMPTYPLAAGKKGWLQVSGPHHIVNDINVGAIQGDIECVFGSNGSITVRDTSIVANGLFHAQIAGYVICGANGGGQGLPFIMLAIAH